MTILSGAKFGSKFPLARHAVELRPPKLNRLPGLKLKCLLMSGKRS